MATGGPFPGTKARSGRDADHSPLSSAEVVNESELCLLSPSTSVACNGTALASLRSGFIFYYMQPNTWGELCMVAHECKGNKMSEK
jgi:hypothetical protein